MYCSKKKKLARLRVIEFVLFARITVTYHRVPASGASLSSPRPKSFTFTFLESSFRTVRLLASGVVRAPVSLLPPRFKTVL
jgi:hypothetical protein